MATLTFKQGAPVATYLVQGCSSIALPSPNIVAGHYAAVGGSTAATQHTRTITGSATGASSQVILALWHSTLFASGDYYEAGDWICRLNVSARNSAIQWKSVYICAERGGVWTTIASKTDVNTLLASTGTKTATLTTGSPSDFTSAGAQTIYWIYGFEKSTSAEQTFKYRSNKNLATPIISKSYVPTATFGSAAIAPAVSPQTLSVAVPLVSFATAAVAPAVAPQTATVSVPTVSFSSAAFSPTTPEANPLNLPYRANAQSGVAARSNVLAGEAVTRSISPATGVRLNTASAYAAASSSIVSGVQRSAVGYANSQMQSVVAAQNGRAMASSGEAVRANASIAMELQFALASGGPEASMIDLG
tara:strand:- start:700 stop:1785 length:1086 start_codon:yes stop_codon:yes gene_type:complete